MSGFADLPLTGAEIIQSVQRNGNTIRPTTEAVEGLIGLDGTETVRVIRGKRWVKTTVQNIRDNVNGGDIVTIKQGKRHVRTTVQSIANL